jgi:hypothetical protein
MEARLDLLGLRLHVRGRAPWVFVTVLITVAAIAIVRLTGH